MSATGFNDGALARWRADPASFIETVLVDPETDQPFVLLPTERSFVKLALTTDADGRLVYHELVYAAPKKTGKTGFAAMMELTRPSCCSVGGMPKATAAPTILSKPHHACSRRSSASCSPVRCWRVRPRSLPIASPSWRPAAETLDVKQRKDSSGGLGALLKADLDRQRQESRDVAGRFTSEVVP